MKPIRLDTLDAAILPILDIREATAVMVPRDEGGEPNFSARKYVVKDTEAIPEARLSMLKSPASLRRVFRDDGLMLVNANLLDGLDAVADDDDWGCWMNVSVSS